MKKRSFKVKLPYVTQTIHVEPGLLNKATRFLNRGTYDQYILVADRNAYVAHEETLKPLLRAINIGEDQSIFLEPISQSKDFSQSERILSDLIRLNATRKVCIIAFGGGYVGDVAGFSASIFMRGVDFVQIPTTMMAQCDAIIGKVAINCSGKKNMLGSFFSPVLTLCDTSLIRSLPADEFRYGLVELWKHALLSSRDSVVREIEKILMDETYKSDIVDLISFSLQTKAKFVERDPLDIRGPHKALSMGHTIANLLETEDRFRHGIAVLYGIVFELLIAKEIGAIRNRGYQRILKTAKLFDRRFELIHEASACLSLVELERELQRDKMNSGGTLKFAMPTNKGYVLATVTKEDCKRAHVAFTELARKWTNVN